MPSRRTPAAFTIRENEPKDNAEIGDPLADFLLPAARQREIWHRFIAEAPSGCITGSDRTRLENACGLQARRGVRAKKKTRAIPVDGQLFCARRTSQGKFLDRQNEVLAENVIDKSCLRLTGAFREHPTRGTGPGANEPVPTSRIGDPTRIVCSNRPLLTI